MAGSRTFEAWCDSTPSASAYQTAAGSSVTGEMPEQVAETYWHVAHQHRSAWTHELDLRAWSDQAWWNHQTATRITLDDR